MAVRAICGNILYFLFPILALLIAGVLLFPLSVSAKTVSYDFNLVGSNLYTTPFKQDINNTPWKALSNIQGSVTYGAEVINVKTGTLLSDGATVHIGDKLILRFKPHEYTDIDWTGVGYVFDTPFGEWLANGVTPSKTCEAKDFVQEFKMPPYPGYSKVFCSYKKGAYDSRCGDTEEEREDKLYLFTYKVPPAPARVMAVYAPLAVVPPEKYIENLGNLSCSALEQAGKYLQMHCAVAGVGPIHPTFVFSDTIGRFFYRVKGRYEVGKCEIPDNDKVHADNKYADDFPLLKPDSSHNSGFSIYKLEVAEKQIAYDFTVDKECKEDDDDCEPNEKPNPPNVDVKEGACTNNNRREYTISVTSTDPDGDKIRYGFDWNNNGARDGDWLPSSGYVNSGTEQTITREFKENQKVTFQVMAQDEKNQNSDWAKKSFTVKDCPTDSKRPNPWLKGPQCIDQSMFSAGAKLEWGQHDVPPIAVSCTAQGPDSFDTGGEIKGTDTVTEPGTYSVRCESETEKPGLSNELKLAFCGEGPSIDANPLRVRRGNETNLTWSSGKAPQCMVTGTNDFECKLGEDGKSCKEQSDSNVPSDPVSTRTNFEIMCKNGQKDDVWVDILGEYQEI